MIHHALKHAVRHVGKFYAANPHKVAPHAAAATQIGSMAWTHRNKVAHHTVNFMTKAAIRGFNLFPRSFGMSVLLLTAIRNLHQFSM